MSRYNRPAWLKGGWGRKTKRLLAARHGGACFYCREPFPEPAAITADHFIPRCLLPVYPRENIVPACGPCNNLKGDLLPAGLVLVLLVRGVKADIVHQPVLQEAA